MWKGILPRWQSIGVLSSRKRGTWNRGPESNRVNGEDDGNWWVSGSTAGGLDPVEESRKM